jgi:pimeloyl-ACP methyl ester carboxylesterase
MSSWLVLGGWAIGPQVLTPLFGTSARYIDSNLVVESLVDNGALAIDWPERLFECIRGCIPLKGALHLAGWSLGAILAAGLVGRIRPQKFAGIAITPSFCRREGFRHGTRASVLASMRDALKTQRGDTLARFFGQAGIDNAYPSAAAYSTGQLCSGLHFLEQASLLPVQPLPCAALFVHGDRDAIIPPAAGAYFARATGATFQSFSGGHGFFQSHGAAIRAALDASPH